MNILLRKKNFRVINTSRRRPRLSDDLRALGVTVEGLPTRDHIRIAHRIFRAARGASVEVNVLWNRIKRHICPICDGVKLGASYETCSYICKRAVRSAAVMLLLLAGCVSTSTNQSQKHQPPAPPSLIAQKLEQAVEQSRSQASLVATQQPARPAKPLYLAWDYAPGEVAKIKAFKVYSATSLINPVWTVHATVKVDVVTFMLPFYPTNAQGWFIVRAVDAMGNESTPNTK